MTILHTPLSPTPVRNQAGTTPLIRKSHVELSPRPVLIGAGEPEEGSVPEVRVIQSGGTIEAIEIRCACGKSVTIQCQYSSEVKP